MKSQLLLLCFFLFGFVSCRDNDKIVGDKDPKSQNEAAQILPENVSIEVPSVGKKHLNINVLLDLSDRIDPKVNPKEPSQKQRDISAIMVLCQALKNNINAFNAFKTRAKMNVFFYPEPSDEEISKIAKDLNVSCEAGNLPDVAKRNKLLYQNIDNRFTIGLSRIYDLATTSGKYPGSNIFRFMKDEVSSCIEDTSLFRNILVIFTDGYIYEQNEKYRQKNRYSYIEKSFEHFNRFRNRTIMATEFEQKDYGLIKVNDKLKTIEILVLELSPPLNSPVDIDILNKYWYKWLREMGVGKLALFPTGQPIYTEKRIIDFLSQ